MQFCRRCNYAAMKPYTLAETMNWLSRHIVRYLICALVAVVAPVHAGDSGKKEIGRTTEREINVVLSAGFGTVKVSKGEPEKIIIAEGFTKREPSLPIAIRYDIRNRVGYLALALGEDLHATRKNGGSFTISGIEGGTWDLRFSNAIPVSFDVELGVAKGMFDLTGLQVKDFKLSAGASDVVLVFDSPNRATIDEMSIESGVGKFTGRNLGNANFKSFRFEGGVGTAALDFTGLSQGEVDVDVQIGLGTCTMIIPNDVGARVFFQESLVSKIDFDRSIRASGENEYVSENYRTAKGRMNIRIDAGLGKVKIRTN